MKNINVFIFTSGWIKNTEVRISRTEEDDYGANQAGYTVVKTLKKRNLMTRTKLENTSNMVL